MKPAFQLFFNKKRQWLDIYLHNTTPNTFYAKNKTRWGYYVEARFREKTGLFGEIHLVKSRVREDLWVHELTHFLADFLRFRKKTISVYNEEYIARLLDGLTNQFWREWKKL